jgi:putative IMPACT (imprinted ancient) family translation regulator
MQKASFMQIKPDYEQYSRLLKLFSTTAVSVINTEFSDGVLVDVAIKHNDYENFKLKLIDYFNGKIEFLDKGSNYYNFG